MLHDDMTLARIMVYAKSIKESKHKKISRNIKRGGSNDQGQPKFKNMAQTQEEPRSAKVNIDKGGEVILKMSSLHVSLMEKDIMVILSGCTGCCYGCYKEGNKVRYYPNIASRGREGKKVAQNVPKDGVQARRRFYALWSRG